MPSDVFNKLKITGDQTIAVLNLPDGVETFSETVADRAIIKKEYTIIFVFIFSLKEFTLNIKTILDKQCLSKDGYLYFVYPKKGNKEYSIHIGRDDFFGLNYIDNLGYVALSTLKFNRMISFSDIFTCIGLKNMTDTKSKVSQTICVDDYVKHIPDLQHLLDKKNTTLKFFNDLTPGYQRDWARFIFSAKTEITRQKRLSEMENILNLGYKTKDLFRQNKK